MFYSLEQARKKTLEDIEAMEAFNKALPAIRTVIRKWDGKVFNKRIEADLKALDLPGNIYLSTCYEYRWEICYSPENTHKYFTVLHTMKPSYNHFDETKSFLTPEKRIKADTALEQIEQKRVEHLKTITAFRDHLETWEEKKKQIEILTKQLNAITDTIPYGLREYFNIRNSHY